METLAERIADFAASLSTDALPAAAVEAAKLHLLDTLGCGLAAQAVGAGAYGRDAVLEVAGDSPSQASAIGRSEGLPAAGAAFANAVLCHALDFDDTHLRSMAHVGTVVGPAALAAAEAAGASGRELIAALVAGSEVAARVGAAAAPAYMRRGFHPTSVCGVFGATVAVARLGRLDAAATTNALGVAGGMAAGTYEYLADGSNTEAAQAGWAAHAGVLAARLAERGATGPRTVFEGRFGLFPTYYGSDGSALEAELDSLGERWETQLVAFKPYPAAHLIHACLDAAARLRREGSLAPEAIEEVIVSIPDPGIPLVLEPHERKVAPRTEGDAKFSLQYSVAAMLANGEVDLSTYAPAAIADPAVLALARRVSHEPAEFPTYPGALPGRLRIRTRDGRTLAAGVDHQRGGPENPMTEEEVRAKFRANASLYLEADAVEALLAGVLALDERADVRGAIELSRR